MEPNTKRLNLNSAGSVVDVEMDPAELTEQVERVVGAPSGKVIGLGSESYVGREESGSEVGAQRFRVQGLGAEWEESGSEVGAQRFLVQGLGAEREESGS